MTANIAPDALAEIVEQQLTELLSDTAFRAAHQIGKYGPQEKERLDWVEGRVASLLADGSLGGAAESGLWLNGASVINSTITADKLVVNTLEAITTNTGDLNVTGTVTVATSYPATGARLEMDSTNGFRLYTGAATTAIRFNMDGSGEIGPNGGSKISWDTTPTVSIPAAVITALTIADVGSGTMGGTYQTSGGTTRIDLSTAGIVMYAAGSETVNMNATTGAITITGSFTVKSAASGARVVIDNAGGIEAFNSSSTTTFRVNAATGEGQLGTGTVSWDSAGSVTIQGSVLVNGTVTASKLSVSTLSSITADVGTLNAGTIDAAAMTISNLSATSITTGTLVADRISGGSLGGDFNLGSSDITVNSTGKLYFGSGGNDYLANDVLHFEISGTESAVIEFKNGVSSVRSEILGQSTYGVFSHASLSSFGTSSRGAAVMSRASNSDASTYVLVSVDKSGGTTGAYYSVAADGTHDFYVNSGTRGMVLGRTNRALTLYGRLYPGTGSGAQSSFYIDYTATGFPSSKSGIRMYEASGWAGVDQDGRFVASANIFPGNQINRYLTDNGTDIGFVFGTVVTTGLGNWSAGSLTGEAGYFKMLVNGTVRRVPFYADA